MEEPSTFIIVVRYAEIAVVGLMFPQALGSLGFYWTMGKRRLLKAASLVIAPLAYFIAAYIFWELRARALIASGYRPCGGFGAAAVFSTIFGTLVHFILSVIVLFTMTLLWRMRYKKNDFAGE